MLSKSLIPQYLDGLRYREGQASSLRWLGEFRGRQGLLRRQPPEILASLGQLAAIESAESSNRIEGVTAPRERIEALVLRPTRPANRTEQEIAGYRDALYLIHESAGEMAFSVNVILQLHTMLSRLAHRDGGHWKKTDNQIVERNPDGSIRRVRFKAVPAVSTHLAMSDLVALYASATSDEREPLVVIPLAILDFLCIHPFTDGNGRMARLLTLMLLHRADFMVGRYISLERVIEQSKESYYEALAASSHGWHAGKNNPHPWLNYFWGVLIAACREFEQRVGPFKDAPGAKTAFVEGAVRRRFMAFSISDIEAECPGVSRDMVRHVLRQMKTRGEIAVCGRGRGAKWLRLDPSSAIRDSA